MSLKPNPCCEQTARFYQAEIERRAGQYNLAISEALKERDCAANLLREVARITCTEHWYDDELEEGSEDCSVCQLLERVRKFGIKE